MTDIIADSIMTSEVVPVIDIYRVFGEILRRVNRGVNVIATEMEDQALREVPVRKVFRQGHRNIHSKVFAVKSIMAHQETRQLSLEEALGESILRRKLGLPSAFPTDTSGRKVRGSSSMVKTTDFGTYRARNRANPNVDERREAEIIHRKSGNRLGTPEPYIVTDDRGRQVDLGHKTRLRPDIEAELSGAGRAELARATGTTLGGALKRSIRRTEAEAYGGKIKASVIAGGGDVDYAKYVEFGTRRSRAQPFLRPALAQARVNAVELMARSIKSEV